MTLEQFLKLVPPPSDQVKLIPPVVAALVFGLLCVRRFGALGGGREWVARWAGAGSALAVAAAGVAASAAVVGWANIPATSATHRVGLLLVALLVVGPMVAVVSPGVRARWWVVGTGVVGVLVVAGAVFVPHAPRWIAGPEGSPAGPAWAVVERALVSAAGVAVVVVAALWWLDLRGRSVTAALVMAGMAQAAGLVLVFAGTASVGQTALGLGAGMVGLAIVLAWRRGRGSEPGARVGLAAIVVFAAAMGALMTQAAGAEVARLARWQVVGLSLAPVVALAVDFAVGRWVKEPWGVALRVGLAAVPAVVVMVRSVPEDLSGY
jgi:hypothetical protein